MGVNASCDHPQEQRREQGREPTAPHTKPSAPLLVRDTSSSAPCSLDSAAQEETCVRPSMSGTLPCGCYTGGGEALWALLAHHDKFPPSLLRQHENAALAAADMLGCAIQDKSCMLPSEFVENAVRDGACEERPKSPSTSPQTLPGRTFSMDMLSDPPCQLDSALSLALSSREQLENAPGCPPSSSFREGTERPRPCRPPHLSNLILRLMLMMRTNVHAITATIPQEDCSNCMGTVCSSLCLYHSFSLSLTIFPSLLMIFSLFHLLSPSSNLASCLSY